MSNVLTVVFDKAEQKIDTVIAAAVNELHSLGHIVKEVRVMGDSGEAKVALNTIEGIVGNETPQSPPPADTAALPPVTDTVENKNPDGSSPVVHAGTVEGAPVDTPPGPAEVTGQPTIDQKREALLAQLEELDKEEADQSAAGSSDPTNSAEGTTPVTA